MTDASKPEERAREAVARATQSKPSQVQVEVLGDANVPDNVPFRAHLVDERGRRRSFRSGVVTAGEVIVDRDRAIARVLGAWHYDARRPVPAREVARISGFLMSDFAQTRALLEPGDWAQMADERKAHLKPPAEIVDGGAPGVEFWILASSDGDLGIPLFLVRIVTPPDSAPRITRTQIGE